MERQPFIQTEPSGSPLRYESDAKKIVKKHLQDKNHVITEEDIRNVRIGISPVNEKRTMDDVADE